MNPEQLKQKVSNMTNQAQISHEIGKWLKTKKLSQSILPLLLDALKETDEKGFHTLKVEGLLIKFRQEG